MNLLREKKIIAWEHCIVAALREEGARCLVVKAANLISDRQSQIVFRIMLHQPDA
jgi:hypothetical protein